MRRLVRFHQLLDVAPWFYLLYGTVGGTMALIGVAIQIMRRPE